jgi:hypothetical protein
MSNRIDVIRGASFSKIVDLVDVNGQPLPVERLLGATAEFLVRTSPDSSTNAVQLTTVDNPSGLSFRLERAAVNLALVPSDTIPLALQTYFYRLRVVLQDGTVSDAIQWSPFDVGLGGSSAVPPPPFENTTKIDHDYQLPGELSYVTPGGSPIENAQIRVYFKSDYAAGNLTRPVGVTTTDAGGRWRNPILVNPGFSYVVRFEKSDEFGPDTRETFA